MPPTSGEHWFDRLSRPHSRRTVLKAAAVAGAALVLPNVRVPRASAAQRPPCFATCRQLAFDAWRKNRDDCKNTGFLKGAVLVLFFQEDLMDCIARGGATWHRDMLDCEEPECGDPGKYPGGNKPRTVCTPNEEFQCGDICCNVVTDCCTNMRTGEKICCARIGEQCGCAPK